MSDSSFTQAVRTVAVFESAKGLLVLLAGAGVFSLLQGDAQSILQRWLGHLHLNMANQAPRVFVDFFLNLSDTRLAMLCLLAALYSLLRFVEAYGLWFSKRWAAWFAVLTAAVYIPFELYELFHDGGWIAFSALLINLAVVLLMSRLLFKKSAAANGEAG